MDRRLRLDTGEGEILLEVPESLSFEVLAPSPGKPAADPGAAIRRAVAEPIGSPRLSALGRPGMKVALIVCDNTRWLPQELIIPAVAEELVKAGVARGDITIVIACGTHAPMDREAIEKMLGREIPSTFRVVNHDAYDAKGLVRVGNSATLGVPILLNRLVVEADLRIGVGVVDPHVFAGYSGGVKILSVGVAGRETIAQSHNARVMEDPGTRQGEIEGNTFRSFLDEAASMVGLDFIVNLVQDTEKRLLGAFAGDAHAAWREAVALARRSYEVEAPRRADIVLALPRVPKTLNLYQAVRAANSSIFGIPPLVRAGGTVILPARCPGGIGSEDFYEDMSGPGGVGEIIERGRREGFGPEGGKAFTVAKMLAHCSLVVTDTEIGRERIERMRLGWAKDASAALAEAAARAGDGSHLVVLPDGFGTLPRVARGAT